MVSLLRVKIDKDLKNALKAKEAARLETLRLLAAVLHNREIEKRAKGADIELSDEEILEIIRREVKKRKEAIDLYTKGNRRELADKEKAELEILQAYLPQDLSEEEVSRIIAEVILRVKPSGDRDFGRVMGEIIKITKGRADAKRIGEIVKQRITA